MIPTLLRMWVDQSFPSPSEWWDDLIMGNPRRRKTSSATILCMCFGALGKEGTIASS
jgi:hypothetical protein